MSVETLRQFNLCWWVKTKLIRADNRSNETGLSPTAVVHGFVYENVIV